MSSVALLLVLLGQAGAPSPPSDPPSPRTEAVMEAVYKDMIRDVPGLAGPYDDVIFCLRGPDAGDPPADMLGRLARDPRVRPRSACSVRQRNEYSDYLVETSTGANAVALNIHSVRCQNDRTCIVHCGYYAASLSASGNDFQLERRGEDWVVTGRQMRWIS